MHVCVAGGVGVSAETEKYSGEENGLGSIQICISLLQKQHGSCMQGRREGRNTSVSLGRLFVFGCHCRKEK